MAEFSRLGGAAARRRSASTSRITARMPAALVSGADGCFVGAWPRSSTAAASDRRDRCGRARRERRDELKAGSRPRARSHGAAASQRSARIGPNPNDRRRERLATSFDAVADRDGVPPQRCGLHAGTIAVPRHQIQSIKNTVEGLSPLRPPRRRFSCHDPQGWK